MEKGAGVFRLQRPGGILVRPITDMRMSGAREAIPAPEAAGDRQYPSLTVRSRGSKEAVDNGLNGRRADY